MQVLTHQMGGGIYVQRGSATSAGTVTINEIDMDKTFVLSVSKGSAGYVASRGTISSATLNIASTDYDSKSTNLRNYLASGDYISALPPQTGTISSTTISGGSTNLTVKEYSATLTSPTTLYCDGACEWQVIEIK